MACNQKCTVIAVLGGGVVNFALAITKLFIGLKTNSISILSDSINNFFDIATCVIAGIALAFSKRKFKRYPFGAERAEYLAAFVVSMIVCIVGISFVYSAATRLMMPVPVWFSWLYFAVLAGTIFVKLAMAELYKRVNRHKKSDVLKALMLDSYVDSAITAMIIIGFVLMEYSGLRIDSVFGIITGLVILVSGIKLMIGNADLIIGKGGTSEEHKAIKLVFDTYKDIALVGIELHYYGQENSYAIAEAEYNPVLSIDEVKKLNTTIEDEINEKLKIKLKITFGRQL